MIPEIGHFALLLCLPIAIFLAVMPLLGATSGRPLWMRLGSLLALGQWVFLVVAFICLTYAFLSDDFSVKLVAMHSNSALPWYFKFSAVWGNHEGSLLLWVLILASWTLAVGYASQSLPLDMRARVLSVLGMISIGFLMFIIFTSNPFERLLLNPVADGNDLNPLLQDFGLIIHPPMLYIGYVGFSVAFAFAIAALMTGNLDAAWARWSRPWTNVAWAFLTIGIALGSWWAYYELGWGGWWFWDPVENASFMPWLAGTALIHSLAATEKRGVFRSWTVLLAILAFSLSLLGTFLVRSGILVSVHAFASDPTRGLFILAFLVLVIGGSLLLYAIKAPAIRSNAKFGLLSRETFLLINNILLAIALSVVLLGTLFPLASSALNLGSYSVGPPYFNAMFVPLTLPMIALMGIAPYISWKRTNKVSDAIPKWFVAAITSLVLATLGTSLLSNQYQQDFHWGAFTTLTVSIWLIVSTTLHILSKAKHQQGLLSGLKRLSVSYWAMVIAHMGIAVTAIGIGLTSVYEQQKDVRMLIGDDISVSGYRYQLTAINTFEGPNFSGTRGDITVFNNEDVVAVLQPEKRFYYAARNVMTEAAIDPSLTRDLYVALGEELGEGAWAVRVHVKPFVRCIWLGALMMALGGFLAVTDKRYRRKGALNA
ncbi:MAG: heme lyase CcmF/NrfE family subunit [Cellvibrionales bacterium]|nr:heme lyase CcmF/NrfE family subunit [Cellvibrionales bacterium]